MAVISRKRALGISDFVAELSAGMAEPFIFSVEFLKKMGEFRAKAPNFRRKVGGFFRVDRMPCDERERWAPLRGGFRSADEEEFAIFGEGPHFILDDELEFVDVVANVAQERLDLVVIGHGDGANVGEAVHFLALLDHRFDGIDDEVGVVVDLFDERDVVGTELLGFLGREGEMILLTLSTSTL